MNLWIRRISMFVVAGAVYLVGQFYRGVWFNPSWPSPCQLIHSGTNVYCNAPYLNSFGWPLISLGEVLAVVAVILLFANADAWRKWFKFTLIYIPIAAVLIFLLFPVRFFPDMPMITRWDGIHPFSVLYAIITFCIVLYTLWKDRHKND